MIIPLVSPTEMYIWRKEDLDSISVHIQVSMCCHCRSFRGRRYIYIYIEREGKRERNINYIYMYIYIDHWLGFRGSCRRQILWFRIFRALGVSLEIIFILILFRKQRNPWLGRCNHTISIAGPTYFRSLNKGEALRMPFEAI